MKRAVHLDLYGSIDYGPGEDLSWDLFQSQALSRLRDVSLSSTPSRFAAHGMAASRFEHSVGVGYLARRLCSLRPSLKDQRDLLIAAGLCHDIGSPPFSHIAELFMYDLVGRTHEEQMSSLLGGGRELNKLLAGYGVDASEVIEIVTGRHKLSPLIAGSIDLDNVDNSIHLLVSLGFPVESYHPLRLLEAFRVRDHISLDTKYLAEIVGWQHTRRRLYDLLHAEEHLSSATMLYRALEYAYAAGELDRAFFALGESDALHHLRFACNSQTQKLIDRALSWRQYHMIYQTLDADEDPRLVGLYDNWQARKQFTDELAKLLRIKPVDFALYVGRDRGEKAIDLPFVGEQADEISALFRERRGPQRLSLFAHKDHSDLLGTDRVEEAVTEVVESLPEAPAGGHVFF